jgi:hypothetical protein
VKELDANGGVCKKCAKKIKKNGATRMAKGEEKPVTNEIESHRAIAFDVHGNKNFGQEEFLAVDTTDFDFDGIEEAVSGISQTPSNERQILFDALEKIVRWCFAENRIKFAAVRFALIGANLYPELIGAKSDKELAKQLGITKQDFSVKRAIFQKHFGIKLKAFTPPNRRNKGLTPS